MSTVRRPVTISIEEYLDGEEHSEVRHEYVDGRVYAMVGATRAHNTIAANILTALKPHLRGSGCRAFMSDMKVRLDTVFYYPDVMVTCEPSIPKDRYMREPILLVEVLSETTEGKDRYEKRAAYQGLPSLREYVLAAQDKQHVEVYRRSGEEWEVETCGPGDMLRLVSVDLALPMAEVYEDALEAGPPPA
jgi:Uma2 family endonuclease